MDDYPEQRYDASFEIHTHLMEWVRQYSNAPQVLTHYTSVRNASLIIESGSAWLFNAYTLNDEQEIDHALDFVAESFANFGPAVCADNVLSFLHHKKSSHASVYVFCLCDVGEKGPDQLGMWRSYGDDGNGVAVQFRRQALLQATLGNHRPLLVRALYSANDKLDFLKALANKFESLCKSAGWSPEDMGDALSYTLARVLPMFKHPAFLDEKEWRLVLDMTPQFAGNSPDIKFNDARRPYVSVDLDKVVGKGLLSRMRKGPVENIMIGPSRRARENAGIVGASLVRSQGWAEIKSSEIPYRGRS